MGRNYYLLFTVFAFLAFFSYSCVDEDFFSTTYRHEFNDFSLEEAKTYFRERSENQLSRSDGSDENLPLSPGDFVPLWDVAVPSVMNGLACYDIPISETSSYHAIIPEEHNGAITARQVKVYQKLVILKDLNDGMMSQYILSLIPSKSYELQKGKQIPELFTTRGDKGGFSGIAIYSCLYTGVTARVDTYNRGRKVNGVFLLDAKDHEELNSKIETAKEQLCMLSLQKRKKVLSRGEYTYNEDTGYFEVETGDLIVYPDDWAGADGMTNAEWVESTRPEGNVDPQPEPDEVEHEEEENSNTDDNKTGDEQNKELNEKIESLNNDEELKSRIKNLLDEFDKTQKQLENGWVRDKNTIHSPVDQKQNSLKYDWGNINKSVTEWYHLHPGGSPIPSFADLTALALQHRNGYLDVDNFSYGIVTYLGATTLVVISESEFNNFVKNMQEERETFEVMYKDFITHNFNVTFNTITEFSKLLDDMDSGLQLIFNSYDQTSKEWNGWEKR